MAYETYESYKDSGIDWIGEIPEHWNVIKAKHCFNIFGGYAFKSNDFVDKGCYLVRIGDITDGNINLSTCKKLPLEFANIFKDYLISEGDILIALTGDIGKIGKVPKTESKLLLNQRVGKLNSDFPDYFKYVINSTFFKVQMNLTSFGTAQENISTENIGNCYILDIVNEEKEGISNFLDKKTSQIDETIIKNKKLISLLEEKKTVLINQVVTKGLNPDVPMKDSGIDWIGEIPEHWEINKIKNTSYVKGRIGWHGLSSKEYSDEGAYLVTGTDFKNGSIDWGCCNHISYERYQQDPYIHLKNGDLLITKDGTIGKLALVSDILDKTTLNSGIFLVRPLNNIYLNEYLYWVLYSDVFKRFFDYIKTGSTIAHLYQETFEDFFFAIPNINEQKSIVHYLNNEIKSIDLIIKKIQYNIELLEEYKESLIHHVVTGKIDVRGDI